MATTIEKASSEEFIIYEDLSELARSGLEYPATAVCKAIWSVLGPVIEESRRNEYHVAIGEIVKDADLHGDEAYPRLVTVRRGLGEVAIKTENRIKERTIISEMGKVERYDRQRAQWHLGQAYLERLFGDAYRHEVEGDLYIASIVVPTDTTISQGILKASHAA